MKKHKLILYVISFFELVIGHFLEYSNEYVFSDYYQFK